MNMFLLKIIYFLTRYQKLCFLEPFEKQSLYKKCYVIVMLILLLHSFILHVLYFDFQSVIEQYNYKGKGQFLTCYSFIFIF